MKDIRRVLEYHGAEHKVVFNFDIPETIEHRKRARKFVTFIRAAELVSCWW